MDRLTPDMLDKDRSDAAVDAARAVRAERRLAMLGELAAIGMRLAREVERQALGEALDGGSETMRGGVARPQADMGLVFSRISRAVRQTLALEARLDEEAAVEVVRVSQAQKSREAARRREVRKQKERVRRHVDDAIAANDDGRDAEGLRLELDERLEDPDYEDELGGRPIGVIVAGICGALGVEVDLGHFTDAELDFHFPAPGVGREAGPSAEAGGSIDAGGAAAGGMAIANDTGDPPADRAPTRWLARPGRSPPGGRISSG
jgi:hypothetical protein